MLCYAAMSLSMTPPLPTSVVNNNNHHIAFIIKLSIASCYTVQRVMKY